MGNHITNVKPTYITIRGNNNSLDSKALDKFDQTSKIDAALSLPAGLNPAYASFKTCDDLRRFIGLSDDLITEDCDIFDDMVPNLIGDGGNVKGRIVSTLEGFEKTRKIGNWIAGTYSRGWRTNNVEHEELERRIESFIPAYKSAFFGTFDREGSKTLGDLNVVRDSAWIPVLPRNVLHHQTDGRLFSDELTDDTNWTLRFESKILTTTGMLKNGSLNELWLTYGHDILKVDPVGLPVDLGYAVYLMCLHGKLLDFSASEILLKWDKLLRVTPAGQALLSVFRESEDENVLSPESDLNIFPFLSNGQYQDEFDDLFYLLQLYVHDYISFEKYSTCLCGFSCVQWFMRVIDDIWDLVSVVWCGLGQKFNSYDCADNITICHELLNRFLDPSYTLIYMFVNGFNFKEVISEPIIDDVRIAKMYNDGSVYIAAVTTELRYSKKEADLIRELNLERLEADSSDFLDGLRQKASKLKGLVVGVLKPSLQEGVNAAEKIMTGYLSQKAGTVKQMITNGLAAITADSKLDAEAKANVYGSLVQGRHTVVVPPNSHMENIAALVPYDSKDQSLDYIDRVGHEIGVIASKSGEPTQDAVVENHVVSEMALRTKTDSGSVGEINRQLAQVSEALE